MNRFLKQRHWQPESEAYVYRQSWAVNALLCSLLAVMALFAGIVFGCVLGVWQRNADRQPPASMGER